VAEYAYCPRLFYFMEVEGIHVPSEDTEQGNRVHRRVDKPSQEALPDGSERPDPSRTVRSMTLASHELQLTATMDLVEIDGLTAVPVEYRKGRPRRTAAENGPDEEPSATVEPWPTDRVQAALQALLLVEAGYEVPEIAIYYAAEKRRVVVPFDNALRAEALATLEAAKQAARGPRPLPLLNDPRCPRCSLLPICFPDEVHQQRGDGPPALPATRRLWPPRDEGLHLVAQRRGTRIGVRGAAMTVSDDSGVKPHDVPLANLESLSLLGGVQISTQAITLLSERGVPTAFLSAAGRLTALVDPLDSVSAETRRAQVRKFDQPPFCLELARAVVVAKIGNQRKLLMRNHAALPPRIAGGPELQRVAESEPPDAQTRAQRRNAEKALRDQLYPLAVTLAGNSSLRCKLHDEWAAQWQADDRKWQEHLRWLARWLMPRGKVASKGTRWNIGGLSLTRVATLTEFRRKVQVGYFTRMRSDGSRAEISVRFGQRTLDAIERLKENRVKQLASRIVEAALGVGIERRETRDLPRPRERIQQSRFAPCHAVVIEDLSHYRPEETRTRRENRATMDWKSAETRKRLADHCQLYGLHLRDVNPQYTSRQDSRTGAPGIRCVEVTAKEFFAAAMWRKQVASARKKTSAGQGDARERYLVALDEKWSQVSEAEKILARLRIPLKGGDLFVSVYGNAARFSAIQADLNAAANIGLRALLDPDFPGKWWYVPCDSKTGHPVVEKVKGSILDNVGKFFAPADPSAETKTKKGFKQKKTAAKQREVVNQWRDPDAAAIRGIEGGEHWQETAAYWNSVQYRVIRLLCQQAGIPPV
jgi:CRISPR-associated protein Cas1